MVPSRLASFQPRGMSVQLRSKAWGSAPSSPTTIITIPPRMIDALSAPYSREKTLDICITEDERKEKGKKRWKREKQGDRLCGCVFAHE